MPERQRDYEAELRAIMDALAESVAQASDEEIIAEAREAGKDPATVAGRARDVLRRALTEFEQRRLREAEQEYEKRVASIRARRFAIPETPDRRRELLHRIIMRKPDLGAALLTLQNREFRSFTDADIQSCLEHLGALGVLGEFEESEER